MAAAVAQAALLVAAVAFTAMQKRSAYSALQYMYTAVETALSELSLLALVQSIALQEENYY
eukprot:12349-Heterococcus_DN1.PRE.2